MLAVLRQRNFILLWAGGLTSALGDTILFVALPFYVYQRTGSALATGIMFIVETIPRLVLGSVAGVFVDRWNRQRIMVLCDVVRGVSLLLLLLIPRWPDLLWVVYPVALVQATFAQFFNPASGALLPLVVGEDHLGAANALNAVRGNVDRLLGPALGGALLSLLGLTSVVLLDAASFLLSAAMIALVRIPDDLTDTRTNSRTKRPTASATARWLTYWSDWLDGIKLVRTNRMVSTLFLVMSAALLAQGLLNVLLVVFVTEVLDGDAVTLGWVASAQGVGGLLGSLGVGRVIHMIQPKRLVVLGSLATGLLLLAMVNARSLPLVLVLSAAIGLPAMGLFISISTLLQANVSNQFRGRVFGALNTTQALMMLVGLGLGSGLGDRLGPVLLLDFAGSLYILASIIALLMLIYRRAQAEGTEVPDQEASIARRS